MITSNVLERVFHIKRGGSTATTFTIDVDNKQYFVTAKHVLPDLQRIDVVKIYHGGIWKDLNVALVGHHAIADVTVFAAIDVFIEGFIMPPTIHKLRLSQDVYFLGFPLGLQSEVGEINRNFPLPLVKKGCASSLPLPNDSSEGKYFYVDGINNRGFSGGPVVFKRPNEADFNVCGVIHGYMYDIETVEPTPTDSSAQMRVKQNSGILKAYSIDNALRLISANPIGKERT